MTDDELIKAALIELLIKVEHFDSAQANTVRKAKVDATQAELISHIRLRLELDAKIGKTLENMPESMRKMMPILD